MLPILLVILIAATWLWLRQPSSPQLFSRLDIASSLHDDRIVNINSRNGEIVWKGKDRGQRSKVSGIGGAGFALSGRKSFAFTFPWPGASGFFCYYDFRSDSDKAIAMELRLLRQGRKVILGRVKIAGGSGYFIQKFYVKPGDRFELRWRGAGRIFIGRPLLYRVLPLPERKTIVMLAADTLRGDQIDAKVGAVAVAPFLAQFKMECARFDRCKSPSTWTLPSFASLFTARNEISHGLNKPEILEADQPFLVEALASSFITVNFNGGCWMRFQSGFHRGFDIVREGGYFGDRQTVMAKSLLDGSLALLETAEFPAVFLFLHTYQVHTPYMPPKDLLRRLDPAHPALAGGGFPKSPPALASSLEEKEHYFRLYQSLVAELDRETNRFISALKRSGLYARTMFILFGDHGEAFGEHGAWEHGTSLYEEQIHIPLLIRFPAGRFAGRQVAVPVSLLDVFPTMLDWFKLPLPKAPLDGCSLLPTLESGAARPLPVVSSLMNCWFQPDAPAKLALTFPRYKILVTFAAEKGGRDDVKVYDLQQDPLELKPLAALPPVEWRLSLPIIRLHRAYLERPQSKSAGARNKPMDPELREQLKALGYL
jgi:choline-sulfatase